jgi:hypothetical protein
VVGWRSALGVAIVTLLTAAGVVGYHSFVAQTSSATTHRGQAASSPHRVTPSEPLPVAPGVDPTTVPQTTSTTILPPTAPPAPQVVLPATRPGPVSATGPSRPPTSAASPSQTYHVYATTYGSYDNTPPGSTDISYPKSDGHPTVHSSAGGTGTYSDPLTMATDSAELPVGTKLYYPYLKRYFVMEDDCTECDQDWGSHRYRFDFYVGNPSQSSAVNDCEASLTPDSQSMPVIADPPANEAVTTTPLWSDTTGHCYRPGQDA